MVRGYLESGKRSLAQLGRDPALPLFLAHLLLVFPYFFPALSDINPWDEAAYVASGRALLQGKWPAYAANPLVALFYALLQLPFQGSPYWLVIAVWLGRLLLFCLLWIAAYRVAGALAPLFPPAVALGFLFVTPLALEMLRFPSDPLFAGLAGLALAALLRSQREGNIGDLGRASAWLGLAALARNDGLVLFPFFLALAAFSAWRGGLLRARTIGLALIPFLALVGGYVLLRGLAVGDFSLETARRTYDNFEAGQQILLSPSGEISPVIEAKLAARRLFGSPEENNYNVFTAIRRNPEAYLRRLERIVVTLPHLALAAYGKRSGVLLALLALRGLLELVRRRSFLTIITLLIWPAHLVTGFFITLFRAGHLQFPYYIIFTLAGLGVWGIVRRLDANREWLAWTALSLALLLITAVSNKMAVFYGALAFLMALWAAVWVARQGLDTRSKHALALTFLLLGGVVLHGDYPSPRLPRLGEDGKEQAAAFLREALPPGSWVATGSPGVVWAADMEPLTLTSTDVPVDRSPEEFLAWLQAQQVRAIYVDHTLYNINPALWSRIEPLIGTALGRAFVVDEGDIQVLILGNAP